MQEETLFDYMKNDRNYTKVDALKEFVSGVDDVTLYILLHALEIYRSSSDWTWDRPLLSRSQRMWDIIIQEYSSRGVKVEDILGDAVTDMRSVIENCPHCFEGNIYGQFPEDGPTDVCKHCWEERDNIAYIKKIG